MYGDNEPGGNATKYNILIPSGNEKEYYFYKRIFNRYCIFNQQTVGG